MKANIEMVQTCPRRLETPVYMEQNADGWYVRDGIYRCSFCGSMKPEDLLEAMRNNCELGPTDKTYKVYVTIPGKVSHAKFYFQHFSVEQQMDFIDLMNVRPKTFKIGYPEGFYVLPYFVQIDPKKEVNDDK